MKKDPVCKMEVDENGTKNTSTYEENTYYFCSTECKREFDDNPTKYANKSSRRKK